MNFRVEGSKTIVLTAKLKRCAGRYLLSALKTPLTRGAVDAGSGLCMRSKGAARKAQHTWMQHSHVEDAPKYVAFHAFHARVISLSSRCHYRAAQPCAFRACGWDALEHLQPRAQSFDPQAVLECELSSDRVRRRAKSYWFPSDEEASLPWEPLRSAVRAGSRAGRFRLMCGWGSATGDAMRCTKWTVGLNVQRACRRNPWRESLARRESGVSCGDRRSYGQRSAHR